MKTVTIRLTMMTDNVKNFVSLVNRYPYDMDLRPVCGGCEIHPRYFLY